jgi:hypothetical protein
MIFVKTAFKTHLDASIRWCPLVSPMLLLFIAAMNDVLGILSFVSVYELLSTDLLKDTRRSIKHVASSLEQNQRTWVFFWNYPNVSSFQSSITYLGHLINYDGSCRSRNSVVKDEADSKSIFWLRSFLGTCQYFRRYVKGSLEYGSLN